MPLAIMSTWLSEFLRDRLTHRPVILLQFLLLHANKTVEEDSIKAAPQAVFRGIPPNQAPKALLPEVCSIPTQSLALLNSGEESGVSTTAGC
jgi:hypothetical protein